MDQTTQDTTAATLPPPSLNGGAANGTQANHAAKYHKGMPTPPTTFGEKLFNILDYYVVGMGVNGVISVAMAMQTDVGGMTGPITQWARESATKKVCKEYASLAGNEEQLLANVLGFEHDMREAYPEISGKNGVTSKFFEAITERPDDGVINKLVNSGILKDAGEYDKLKEAATKINASAHWKRWGANFLALNTGGTILMAPIKILEDHKLGMVKWFDEKFGGNLTEEQKQQRDLRYDYLEHAETPQTWGSVVGARMLGMSTTIGEYFLIGPEDNLLKKAGLKNFDGTNQYIIGSEAKEKIGMGGHLANFLRESTLTKGGVEWLEGKLEQGHQKRLERYRSKGTEKADAYVKILEDIELTGAKRFTTLCKLASMEAAWAFLAATNVFLYSRVTAAFLNKGKTREGDAPDPVESEQQFVAKAGTAPEQAHSAVQDLYLMNGQASTVNPATAIAPQAGSDHQGVTRANAAKELLGDSKAADKDDQKKPFATFSDRAGADADLLQPARS